MASRRTILLISIAATAVLHALMLWMAPWVTLLESDRLATRIATRFHVEFLDKAPQPPRKSASGQSAALRPGKVNTALGEDPGTLPIEDTAAAPPVETPRLAQRLTGEPLTRAYDLEPEAERINKMDARILEIAQETARRDIDITRRLVRPSPGFTLPESALPALRSRDIGPEDIALEPVRLGAGLLAQAIPDGEGTPGVETGEKPAFEPAAFTEEAGAGETLPDLEKAIVETPIARETQQAREESPYSFLDDMVDIRLETFVESPSKPGYFRLSILPRKDAVLEPLPKDVTIILDASKSMQQRKLDLAARGISEALGAFRPQDRFNILLFRDTVVPFQEQPLFATPENIQAARNFLSGLEAQGQTDIYNAMLSLSRLQPRPNQPGIILVVGDGRPTVGIQDARAIINTAADDNALRNSIFTYGAGNTVDKYLLALLAYRNKGEAFVSPKIQDTPADVQTWLRRLNDPLLVNLKTDYGSISDEEAFPKTAPDFYRGKPIVLYGRYDPGKKDAFAVRITGHAGEKEKEMIFRADLAQAEKGGRDIAQGWAFEKAYHLIGEMSKQGETPEMIGQIRDLSTQYNIRTIYDQ